MTISGAQQRFFYTSAALQEFLLTLPAGGLVIVPQLRLAHQVWRRQRLAARAAGKAAWEPLAMMTLSGWWQQLGDQLWLTARFASTLERLLLWLEAMSGAASAIALQPDLSWAAALDEAYDLCQRYQMPEPAEAEDYGLINWRQAVTQQFTILLAKHGLLAPAARPAILLGALRRGELCLPGHLTLVGLETPAPAEEQWLSEVARRIPVLQVHLAGRLEPDLTVKAIALPDRRQEMEWVLAQILELAQVENVPFHRLAVTAPNLETYLPDLRRMFHEVLGSGVTETGGVYNFSLGLALEKTMVFQAALLPLKFILGGEQRQDLLAWLQSPYYGGFQGWQGDILHWDVAWRQQGVGYGLARLREAEVRGGTQKSVFLLVEQAIGLLPVDAPAAVWRERLLEMWNLLGFPVALEGTETGQWRAFLGLLEELAGSGGERSWTGGELVEWLSWGAGRLEQGGEGSSEVGIQVQGLLELRGLDFEAVFCLGLNMGVFPPPPRSLPLLSLREKALVLGGNYDSQREFAETSFRYLLASAPRLIFTRPLVEDDEERLPSPLILGEWENDQEKPLKFAVLSQPHPAWLRSPSVRAAFLPPTAGCREEGPEPLDVGLPEEISLSALETALTCPCQFFLKALLGLEELPDIAPGLPPRDRGSLMHEVLQAFTCRYLEVLNTSGKWDDGLAWQYLQETVAEYRHRVPEDIHWQAEFDRWLAGEGALLRQWLREEKERFLEGWRWLAMEDSFQGLRIPGWPTAIKGRLDRVDGHKTAGLMLWDYKTGTVPGKAEISQERHHFQLPGYLLAVQQGLTAVPRHSQARAGLIGLKSSRPEHLEYEDYKLTAEGWQEIVRAKLAEVARLGVRIRQGDFSPDPSKPPPDRNNSCQYCHFSRICGYRPEAGGEAET